MASRSSPRKSKPSLRTGEYRSRRSLPTDSVKITVGPQGQMNVLNPTIGHVENHYYIQSCFHHQQGRRELRAENDQALQDPCTATDSVLKRFSEQDLQRPVEERHLNKAAYALDDRTRMERLARKLSLDSAEVKRIKEDYPNFLEVAFQMLLTWKRKNSSVTLRDLVKVLCESKMDKCAIALSF